MVATCQRLPNNTLEIRATIPWTEVESTFDKIFLELAKQIELPGFRKGMAPKDLTQKHIDKKKVVEETLKEVIPRAYSDSIKELDLHPIITPQIEALEANIGKDWQILILTCEKPAVKLGNYRQAIQNLKKSKQPVIWVPGKKTDEKTNEPTIGELLDTLYQEVTVEVADILIKQETNRLLSNTYSELQKLGLTVDEYLKSQGKTSDQLREEYTKQARKTLTLEFALEEIADKEHVTIDNTEIDEVVQKAKSEAEKQALTKERYFLGSLLRRQKTLSTLLKQTVEQA